MCVRAYVVQFCHASHGASQAIKAAKGPPTSGASVDGNSVEVAIAAGADAETAKIVVAEIGAEMVARTVNGIGSKTATSRGIQEELELNGHLGTTSWGNLVPSHVNRNSLVSFHSTSCNLMQKQPWRRLSACSIFHCLFLTLEPAALCKCAYFVVLRFALIGLFVG